MGVHECVSHKLIDPFQVLYDKVAWMLAMIIIFYTPPKYFSLVLCHNQGSHYGSSIMVLSLLKRELELNILLCRRELTSLSTSSQYC